MALNVTIDQATVTGWVNKLLGEKGFELARPINVKNANGQWDEVGKNYFKVWTSVPVELNTRVDVTGRVTIKETEYEGKTRIELHIRATEVKPTPVPNFGSRKTEPASDAPF